MGLRATETVSAPRACVHLESIKSGAMPGSGSGRRSAPRRQPEAPASAATKSDGIKELRTHWIEADAYDRAALRRLAADSPSLRALEESGGRLLPHFDGFVLDLFALAFKLNIVVYPDAEVVPSAGLYRLLLGPVIGSPALEALRRGTVLDEAKAGLAAVMLGDRLLALLKSERIVTRAEMLDFWNLEHSETELAGRQAQAATARDLETQARSGGRRQLGQLAHRLEREAETAAQRLQQKAVRVRADAHDSTDRHVARIADEATRVAAAMEQSASDAESFSLQLGGGERTSAGAQIELGKQLADNPKLKKLSRLVGSMRTLAWALRRRLFERANEEVFDVELGAELSRLLPHELLALRHPALHRDFARRLIDGRLTQYAIRGTETKGRGPMVVCLDGSSSMAGDKEIWAKAITLTLLDIAQRQRRRFRAICFAGADTPLHVLDLNPRQRYATDLGHVFALAEYFPGGGTDFQKPLAAAVDCLRSARFKRGDIVFITDGECRVDPIWLSTFRAEKAVLGFTLFSVLIDVGTSSLGALKDFSDQITTVTQLTSEAGREVFLKM